MEPITLSIALLYVSDKLLTQFIKEEGYSRIRLFFFPKEKYCIRLRNVLLDTINEFQDKFPAYKSKSPNKIAFYESELAFEELAKFILFKTKESSLVIDKFKNDERIIVPDQKQIGEFVSLFQSNVNKDKNLKKIFVEENYKEEIFQISEKLSTLNSSIQKIFDKLNDVEGGINLIKGKFNSEIELLQQFNFVETGIPPLIECYSSRDSIVDSVINLIKTNTWVELHGSIGIGKTQFAILVSGKLNGKIYWFNLRDFNEKNYFFQLYAYFSSHYKIPLTNNLSEWIDTLISKLEGNSVIILDDLPRINSNEKSSKLFFEFVDKCSKNVIKIVSTSNFEIPDRIRTEYFSGIIKPFLLPFLSEEEACDILLSYGATKELANVIKKVIHPLSSGHPLIISSICRYLKKVNWKFSNEELTSLFSGDYSIELSDEVYQKLLQTIADEESRELLFRLKLVLGNISESELSVVCDVNPAIRHAPEKLSSMLGLWVQKTSSTKFQLSPLFKSLKGENLNLAVKDEIHYKLGKQILDKKKFDQFEAMNCLIYFINAKRFNDAGFVLTLVLNESRKNASLYFDFSFNLFWTTVQLPEQMDLFLKLYIRVLQIMIYQDAKKDINFIRTDLEKIIQQANREGIDTTTPTLLLSTTYTFENPDKANSYFVKGLKGFNELKKIKEFKELYGNDGFSERLIWGLCFGIKNEAEMETWFKTFENLSPEAKDDSLKADGYDMASIIIGQNIIKEEENKSSPDWDKVISIFDNIESRAIELGIELLASNAVRHKINILCDRKSDIDKGRIVADSSVKFFAKGGVSEFIIKDAIGRQLYYHAKSDEAIPYLMDAVLINVPDNYTEKLDTFLVVSWILGIKDKEVSHFYCEKAFKYAKESENMDDITKAKVFGEYAVSLWLKDELGLAIKMLIDGYEKIINTYKSIDDYKATTIRIGHVLNYFYGLISSGKTPKKTFDESDYPPPVRGFFFRTNDKELSESMFFQARLFINAHLCLNCFEALNDLQNSKKWAQININISEKIKPNPYYIVLTEVICYLIADNRFFEAFIVLEENRRTTNYLHENNITIDQLSQEDNFKKFTKEYKNSPGKLETLDELLIEYCLVPTTLHILSNFDSNKEAGLSILSIFLVDFEKLKSNFKDPLTHEKVVEILSLLYEESIDMESELRRMDSFDGESKTPIRMLLYLVLSLFVPVHRAYELHLTLIPRLDQNLLKLSKASFRFLAVPFFEGFWKLRLKNHPNSFIDSEIILQKMNVQLDPTKIEMKNRILMRLVGVGLQYKFTKDNLEWFQNNLKN